ncbi:S8 family peptidase [Cohnella faecalis]|uniref:S8 family peptidase n=1 Tax=Cohnella faecalis TaxID=2315694 RepID=UPI0036078BA3
MKPLEHLLRGSFRRKPRSGKPQRRIVVLRRNSDYRKCLADLAKAGIRPVRKSDALRMICCHSKRSGHWKHLRRHPGIAYVEKDSRVKAHGLRLCGSSSGSAAIVRRKFGKRLPTRKAKYAAVASCPPKAPWNVCRVKSPPVWSATRGSGVRVGIIDTGIAKHPDLSIAGGVNTIARGRSYADDNGHGTHVAGIVAATGRARLLGNAPAVRLYAIKALDKNGEGYISDIVEGIEWGLKRGIRVMNMSFGMTENNRLLRDAIKRARRRGTIISASAGNSGKGAGTLDVPARYPETLAVAALTRKNRVASFSSRGRGIDLSAPGVSILSTWKNGKYRRESGTSMATPHVTGCAALLRAVSPAITATVAGRLMKASARRISGGSRAVGAGLLQASPAVRALSRNG